MLAGIAARSESVRPQFSQMTCTLVSQDMLGRVQRIQQRIACLNAKLTALVNDVQRRLDGRQALGVVAAFRMQEEVLHVNNDKRCETGSYSDPCILWPFGRLEHPWRRSAAREIVALGAP